MYFSSLYLRGPRSSQIKTCCLMSSFNIFEIHFVSKKLISSLVWHKHLAMFGRGFSLFVLVNVYSLYVIWLEIDIELICYWEEDLSPSSIFSLSSIPEIRIFSLMYCSYLSSWKTTIRFVFWTISSRPLLFLLQTDSVCFMFNHLFLYSI